jgi:hypothetical protein
MGAKKNATGKVSQKRVERRLITLKPDKIKWNYRPVPPRIVAVGDVHGDIAGLACILIDLDLIDRKGRWTGKNSHLVLNGDLVGGRNARLLLQFVMRLEEEARSSGGAVHPLLGNHDVEVFYKDYQKRTGKTMFQKYQVEGARNGSIRDAFSGDTVFAGWLRRRNAVVKIGPTIFTHAGLNVWAFKHHPRRINATIRAWIRYWQGVDGKPDKRTQWVALGKKLNWAPSSTGPMWTRSYKVTKRKNKKKKKTNNNGTAPHRDDLARLLKKYKARRMVIGHAPVAQKEILLSHPVYGPKVIMIDSRISDKKGGRLSCVEIRGNEIRAHYPDRAKAGEKIRELELKRLKNGD